MAESRRGAERAAARRDAHVAEAEPRVSGVALPVAFFARPTETVARDLLGCVLASRVGGVLTTGVIVETEAYLGSDDPGSHAATKGVT
ncbi:MAG: DNA-3-methyladenine glycosylase, partial [Coriobacteriia bacterium]|nr:DNA-3-methyladenine glycosylase [Coriobacteriia bacterium]